MFVTLPNSIAFEASPIAITMNNGILDSHTSIQFDENSVITAHFIQASADLRMQGVDLLNLPVCITHTRLFYPTIAEKEEKYILIKYLL